MTGSTGATGVTGPTGGTEAKPVGLVFIALSDEKDTEVLEKNLGKTAEKSFLPMQQGDVPATYADVGDLMRDVGYAPKTPIETGIQSAYTCLAARESALTGRFVKVRQVGF